MIESPLEAAQRLGRDRRGSLSVSLVLHAAALGALGGYTGTAVGVASRPREDLIARSVPLVAPPPEVWRDAAPKTQAPAPVPRLVPPAPPAPEPAPRAALPQLARLELEPRRPPRPKALAPIELEVPRPAASRIHDDLLPHLRQAPEIPKPRLVVRDAGFAAAEAGPPARTDSPDGPVAKVAGFETAAASGRPDRSRKYEVGQSGFGRADVLAKTDAGKRSVRDGGFSAASVQRRTAISPAGPQGKETSFRPVRVVSKPDPEYTAEARAERIEGEVVLEVRFGAGGEIEILRVVRGLGYGLDENAAVAARNIRFEPARRDSMAVDAVATVRIRFRMAY